MIPLPYADAFQQTCCGEAPVSHYKDEEWARMIFTSGDCVVHHKCRRYETLQQSHDSRDDRERRHGSTPAVDEATKRADQRFVPGRRTISH